MKLARLLIGGAVILGALWILIGEQMAGASADAVINARVVTLRSHVAGHLDLKPRALGSRVAKGEVLGAIDDPLADRLRLDDLRMERAFQAAIAARVEARLTAERGRLETLEARSVLYGDRRLAELRARLEHARTRLDALEQAGYLTDAAQTLSDGVDDQPRRLPAEPQLFELAVEHARERVEVLEIAVRAAEKGVFLGDGYNDAPNAEQKATDLRGEIAGLEAEGAEAAARLAAIDARIAAEQRRVNGLAGGEFASPVEGIYWQVLQADGVTVQRGDPILRLVDCASTLVTLSVSEAVYNTLRPGQKATFRPEGRGEVFEGTVARLAGSGAATVYETLAVAASQKHLQRFDVAVILPALTADAEHGCAVGRTGRVFLDGRPLDGLRRFLR